MASLADSADGLFKKADRGDLSYNAARTHRLGIIISGSAPGTGTNTPNAVAFASTATPVPMVNIFNLGYDFVPAGGTLTSTRDRLHETTIYLCRIDRDWPSVQRKPLRCAGAAI